MAHEMTPRSEASATKAETVEKKDLELYRLEVEPAENGYVVRCFHRPKASAKKGGMVFIEPEIYAFSTAGEMLAYVGEAFGEAKPKKKTGPAKDGKEYVAQGREAAA